jgi:hypothetical protein
MKKDYNGLKTVQLRWNKLMISANSRQYLMHCLYAAQFLYANGAGNINFSDVEEVGLIQRMNWWIIDINRPIKDINDYFQYTLES